MPDHLYNQHLPSLLLYTPLTPSYLTSTSASLTPAAWAAFYRYFGFLSYPASITVFYIDR